MDEQKKPYTGIPGQWNQLNKSLRNNSQIADLAHQFQQTFFTDKYEIEAFVPNRVRGQEKIEYIIVDIDSPELINQLIYDQADKDCIHPNDICIQSAKIDILREIDFFIQTFNNYKTTTTIETQEIYFLKLINIVTAQKKETLQIQSPHLLNELFSLIKLFENEHTSRNNLDKAVAKALCYGYYRENLVINRKLSEYLKAKHIPEEDYNQWFIKIDILLRKLSQHPSIKNYFNNELQKIRKNKKWNFWMNSGLIKLSTIHSFKGWEVDSLFLIIEGENTKDSFITDELIYTAITRCSRNLFILDSGKSKYSSFFQAALSNAQNSEIEEENYYES